ncbi:pyruvate dehydrogenase complex dihydrolipoyllysine-residue acetyltransferase [Candidatus Williamhamiltonella defendens]|uniref:pyruvate dehydrogenase complex dihydrolipoyllysine-residue acetyltransferase n=1 Tax=Candidatus Williamhamiltonella defendens TaxID=138072 RepID=UPI000D601D4F|nr:pyruvate dehydrogenase complex dihydrolipoyllysine-residue acetyltransferase [Candidatus Hamiltonella defensa]AWK16101.1 dihydrolipoamide acetyltransferase [Candidatus Hamiltonella defensa]
MVIEIKMPDIGTDTPEVIEIMVKVGDVVVPEQTLLCVEGDKASMDIPSPHEGTIKEIKVSVGDKVETGKLIMLFESSTEAVSEKKGKTQAPAPAIPAQENTKTVSLPDVGSDELEVTEILVKVGDSVTEEQSLITVEGDKASMEVPAPFSGTVKEIQIKTGDKVKTGSMIMIMNAIEKITPAPDQKIQKTADALPEQKPEITPSKPSAPSNTTTSIEKTTPSFTEEAYTHATPVIRRLARELGVNLEKVSGTGRKGRILKEDVQSYVKNAVQTAESASSGQGNLTPLLPWPKIDFNQFGETEEIALTRIQKMSGDNLSRNWVMIPHVTQFDETDITDLEDFRKKQNIEAEKRKLDVKITPVVFMMKAVAQALETFPRFNSSLSLDGKKLILKKYINIGVAVDTPNGLVVPVFRDVNKKGVIELSKELMFISQKARSGKLTASDMQGGCFTISSLGGIGGTAFTPIVNAPEVAILGVSKSAIKPIWNGKEFLPRLMLPLSLSFDHRVIDGAAGARFVSHISVIMADIRRLIM